VGGFARVGVFNSLLEPQEVDRGRLVWGRNLVGQRRDRRRTRWVRVLLVEHRRRRARPRDVARHGTAELVALELVYFQ
jgi:diadenosine tetraphosphatase ApaH/serine/threonine PP2A family protein phosphatase